MHLEVRGPRRTKGADQDTKRCGIVGGEAASFASMEHSKQISINLDGIFPKKIATNNSSCFYFQKNLIGDRKLFHLIDANLIVITIGMF